MTIKTMKQVDAQAEATENKSQAQLILIAVAALVVMLVAGQFFGLVLMSAGLWGPALVIYWLIQTANHKSDEAW